MKIARILGTVTMSRRIEGMKPGRLLIAEKLDAQALAGYEDNAKRASDMPESFVVYDELGAGVGQLIACGEGPEAAAPFYPTKVPIDAYNAAILNDVDVNAMKEGA